MKKSKRERKKLMLDYLNNYRGQLLSHKQDWGYEKITMGQWVDLDESSFNILFRKIERLYGGKK